MVDGAIKHLPLTGAEIFGRAGDLAWLDACWRDGVFVASIVAWGGVGKTSLVTKWLANMRDDGWRGAARLFDWSFYRQGTNTAGSSDTFFAEALKVFGDPDPTAGSPWDKGERLAKLVREKRTLLVLDGVEPMQYGPGEQEGQFKDPALQTLVKELASNNNGFLVITSRLRLRDLDGLSGAKVQTKALEHLSAEAAAQLLRALGVKGTEDELRAATNEYQGHGLALTLLGSYLEDVAEGDIRRRNEIGPLHYDERLGGHARRVMEAYEPWLGKTERAILRMVGLFDRPATEDEIAALRAEPVVSALNDTLVGVSGRDWNKALAKLRRIRLIAVDSGTAIDAHPLVRQHFGEQLKRENLDAWREGHRRLYEFLRTKAPDLPNTLAEMEPLYAAVVHGCLAGKNQEALDEVLHNRIRRGNEAFNISRLGSFGGEVAMLSAFFDSPWERLAPGLSEPDQAFVLNEAGIALRATGRSHEAVGLMRLGLDRCIAQKDWKQAARAANNLSELLQSRGDLREAIETARQSVELADTSVDAVERSDERTTLAAVQHAMGQREDAATSFTEAERMWEATVPQYPLLYSLAGFHYCDLLLDQGQTVNVRKRASQTLEWAKQVGAGLLTIALDHLSLGRAHFVGTQRAEGGDLNEAASHIKQAVEGLRGAGHQDDLPLGLLARAALHIHTRAYSDARRDLDEAMTIATRCGFRLHEADAHLGYARLAIEERQATTAREHLEKARTIVEATGYHRRDEEIAQLQQDLDKLPPEIKPITQLNQPIVSPSPIMTNNTAERVDLGIVIALQEEFRDLLALSGPYTQHKEAGLTAYRFNRGSYRIIAAFVGDMGQSQATRVAERMISTWHPESIVVMGIAAGVHEDLRVGDVYVPPQAVQYLQDAKAIPNPNDPTEFVLVLGAPARRADFALMEAVRNLEFGHAAIYKQFVDACAQDLAQLLRDETKRQQLIAQNLIRPNVAVLADGHVATGPVVGAAAAFSAWIRGHARNVKALEMETSAVFMSAQQHSNVTRAFAIRGISDYGDDRKKALDEVGGGALRKYAMRNAVRFLWALLDANALPRFQTEKTEKKLSVILSPIQFTQPPQSHDGPSAPVTRTEHINVIRDPVVVLAVASEWASGRGGLSTFNRELCVAWARIKPQHRVFCLVPTKPPSDEIAAARHSGVEIIVADNSHGLSEEARLALPPPLPVGIVPRLIIGHGRVTGPAASAIQASFRGSLRVHFIHIASEEIEYFKDQPPGQDAAQKAEERTRHDADRAASANLAVAVGPLLARVVGTELHARGKSVLSIAPGLPETGVSSGPPPGVQCLLLGRAEDYELKGLDIAAAAMSRLDVSKMPSEPWLLVRGAPKGTGNELLTKLRASAPRSRIKNRIHEYSADAGRVANDILASSLVLMPSRTEGFGLVGLEAIAAGVPVLISDRSGLGELLEEECRTLARDHVVPVTGDLEIDAAEWVRNIDYVLRDREAAFVRARKLRDALLARLTWGSAITQILAKLNL